MGLIRNSLGALLLAGAAAGAAGAASLVVRSSGPTAKAYPPGKSVPDGQAIALQAGDQLTLLDGRGTRILRGPGSFSSTSSASDGGANARLAAMLGTKDTRVRIGAVRSPGAQQRIPSIWYIDAQHGGTSCVADASRVTLWRTQLDQDQTLTITGAKGAKTQVAWPSGGNTLAWPDGVPVTNGADYTLTIDGGAPAKLHFAVLGAPPSGLEDTAASLIREGCQRQLELLSDTFAVPSDTGPNGG